MKNIKTIVLGALVLLSSARALPALAEPVVGVRVTEKELTDLCRTVYAECLNQDTAGRAAVVHVCLERVRLPGFPKTLERVLAQPRAFSCRNGKGSRLYRRALKFTLTTDDARWQEVVQDVRAALVQGVPSYAQGVVMYKEKHVKRFPGCRVQPTWAFRAGDHDFYVVTG